MGNIASFDLRNLFRDPNDLSFGNGNVGAGKADKNGKTEGTSTEDLMSVLFGKNVDTTGELTNTISFAIENPDLEPSAITSGQRNEHYVSILEKLSESRGKTIDGKSIMFDIYAMMDLIQEMSQRLRNALRELRRLENTAIYTNIKAQAAVQREAAYAGVIAGAVMCAVQVGVVFTGMGLQIKGAAARSSTVGKGSMQSAVTQEKLLTNLKVSDKNAFNAIDKQVGALQKKNGGPGPTQKNYWKGLQEQKSGTEINNKALADVAEAKNSYMAARDKYLAAKESEANGVKVPKSELKALESNMESARGKYDLARAEQAQVTYKLRSFGKISETEFATTTKTMGGDIKDLRDASKTYNAPLNEGAGGRSAIAGMVVQQVGMAVGNFLAQLASGIKELIANQAMELSAEQKLLEEQFDQIKDLFSLALSVIQKSIDIFSAVVQKESSVLEQIFQHI